MTSKTNSAAEAATENFADLLAESFGEGTNIVIVDDLKGIVVKNKQPVFLDKRKCINFANKNRMFISVK